MNQDLLKLIRKKRKAWKSFSNSQDGDLFVVYKSLESKVKKAVRNAKRNYERNLARKDNRNNKAFYKYIGSKNKIKERIGPLKVGNDIVDDNKSMAKTLNDFFVSVFTQENISNIPVIDNIKDDIHIRPLDSLYVRDTTIIKKIMKLKKHSAPGPDKISVHFLQQTANTISRPLKLLFQKFLHDGFVPEVWKQSNVVPIFKKGSKFAASNYRPISLTSIICKIMESVIKDSLLNHLITNDLIFPSQHGFMPGRSCTTNLLEYLEEITSSVDDGQPVDVIYLDFAKAFDKVPHQRLKVVLEAHGIKGEVLQWICEWLNNRIQRVILDGEESDWVHVLSGVPQGSVLGPILFLVYINTLDTSVQATAPIKSKFADDSKVGRQIKSQQDATELQLAIKQLETWADTWQMTFNASKCSVIHFGYNNQNYEYEMYGEKLNSTNEEKDVGITINCDLKPSHHVKKAVNMANKVIGIMSRSFHYRDKKTWIGLYKSYVRPHVEYSTPCWSPWTARDIEMIESVQERAINMCSSLKGTTYLEKLKEVGLMTLADRRLRADMIQVWKIIHKKDRVNETTWFTRLNTNTNRETRSTVSGMNIQIPRANLEIRRNFFSVRSPKMWNTLPDNIKILETLDAFKSKLDSWINQRHTSNTVGR